MLVQVGEIDAHAQGIGVFLWYQYWIGHPRSLFNLADKSSLLESVNFGANGLALRLREASQGLPDWFRVRVDIEGVLSEFPGNSWHIGRLPGEYFPALTEELNERAFQCFSEALRHVDTLALICQVNLL